MKHLLSSHLYSNEKRSIDTLMDSDYTRMMICEFGSSEPAVVLLSWELLPCCGDSLTKLNCAMRYRHKDLRDKVNPECITSTGTSLLLFWKLALIMMVTIIDGLVGGCIWSKLFQIILLTIQEKLFPVKKRYIGI